MTIKELINSGANITIAVTPTELKEFALTLVSELAKVEPKEEDRRLTISEAAEMIGKDKSTIHRWRKMGYLKPIIIGKKPYFLKSDIDKILNGGRAGI